MPEPGLRPSSRVRYLVVAFTVALAGVTYLDRVCISILAPSIMRDLQLTPIQMSQGASDVRKYTLGARGSATEAGTDTVLNDGNQSWGKDQLAGLPVIVTRGGKSLGTAIHTLE